VTIEISGATPDSRVIVVGSATPGSVVVPSGGCAGVNIDIGGPFPLLTSAVMDGTGTATFGPTLTAEQCDWTVQMVDMADCSVSDPIALSPERPQWTLEIGDHFDDNAAFNQGPDGPIYVAAHGTGDEWRLHVYNKNAVVTRSVAIVGLTDVYDLHVGDDGAVFFAGSNMFGMPSLARLDSDDTVRWAFSLDYVQPFHSISALADGTIVAGSLRVLLVDPETGVVRSQRNQSEYGRIYDIQPAADGGYWATTTTDDNSLAPQFQSLIKVGSDGIGEWGKVVELADATVGEKLAVLTDGSVVVVGGYTGECLVSRFSDSGLLLWSQQVGATESFDCRAVTGTADGGIVIGGGTGVVDPLASLVKLTADGALVWARDYGFAGNVDDVLEGADGALLASSPFPGSHVIRADAEGRTGCESDSSVSLDAQDPVVRDVLYDDENEKVILIESPTVVPIDASVFGGCGF
jgi:hypothetical protein